MPNDRVITRENFLKYEEVRKSGKYDMLMHEAQRATGLTEDQYIALRIHYARIAETYKKDPDKKILLNRV